MANQTELMGYNEENREFKRVFASENNSLSVNQEERFVSFTANYTGAQTNLNIITPTAGKRLHVCGVHVNTDTKTTDVNIRFATSGRIVLYLYTSNNLTASIQPIHIDGDINEPLTLDCGADTFIAVCYCCHC